MSKFYLVNDDKRNIFILAVNVTEFAIRDTSDKTFVM